MCGDSTSIESVEKLMKGEKADMVFTDPPYNQETDGGMLGPIGSALRKQSREIAYMCDFKPQEFLSILTTLFNGQMNAMIFCSKDLVVEYLQWAKEMGFAYNILVWKKPSAIPIGGSYRPDVEYLLAIRKSAIFNSNIDGVSYSKVLEHSREKDKVHPTMKPVALLENQILISSKRSVLDLFGGSGSTLIACEKTNRKCFMMEIDPHYCDVIIARFEKYTGKKAKKLNGKTK
jgi:DNA modification methylase